MPVSADCVLDTRCALRSTLLSSSASDTWRCSPASTPARRTAVADVHEVGAQQGVERHVVAHHADHGRGVIVERHEHRLIAVGPGRRHVADGVVVERRILGRDQRGADRARPRSSSARAARRSAVRRRCGCTFASLGRRWVPARARCAPSSASAPAHAVARSASVTRRGIAARRAICLIGFSIPFFICTSTRVSCGFDVARIYAANKASSNVSSERRRRFATVPTDQLVAPIS